MKLNRIREFVKQREKLISGVLSILILVGWTAFLLRLVFAHGVCCGDDAVISFIARSIDAGKAQMNLLGFDLHLLVLAPVYLGIQLLGNLYFVPGLSMVILNTLLLVVIGSLLRNFDQKSGLAIAALAFFYLNIALLSNHFEHWYAALGEVPAGLLILSGALLLYSRDSWVSSFLAGLSFSAAFLTKMVSLIAFFGALFSLLIQFTFIVLQESNGEWKSPLKKVFFLVLGFVSPLLAFEGLRRFGLGPELHLDRWVRNGAYLLHVTGLAEPLHVLESYQKGAAVFLDRFGVPFLSLILLLGMAGVMVRKDERLKKLFYLLLAIFVFHSAWWFFFSVHWARHYLIAMLVAILAIVLPFLSSRPVKWRAVYSVVLLLFSALAWKQISVPFEGLNGHFYTPTEKTEALLASSELLSEQVGEDELVISQNDYTLYDLRYLIDEDLRYNIFYKSRKYNPPFWIAVNTKFMNQQDPAFMQLLRGCSGLEEYEGYLVGRCE